MKKIVLFATVIALGLTSFAQEINVNVLDGVYIKEHMPTKTYMAYPYVREADVMWSKRIWRVIDLREKINLPLGYPKTDTRDRKSLMDVIWNAVKEGSLTAY